MAIPKITMVVEPSLGDAVVFGPLASGTSFGEQAGQLSLRFWITNHEKTAVVVTVVALSFVPPPAVDAVHIPVSIKIGAGGTEVWSFATANNIFLPDPAPTTLTVSVSCGGFSDFSDPVTITLALEPHANPVTGGAYLFPARAEDLGDGEFWQGISGQHGAAGKGVQLFGYDMGVVGYDVQTDTWNELKPGGSFAKNEDYRVWGKRIYAMADGVVKRSVNDKSTNPNPPADLSPPDPVEGNCFYIQHGPELMLYAHLQKGTLNGDLLAAGSPVKAGDFLGLAGNSGNSTGPHLHIHAIKGTVPWQGPPQPITFRSSRVIDRTALSGYTHEGPWVTLQAQCLPAVMSVIWPNAQVPLSRVDLSSYRAIDPLALILSNEVYVRLTLPDPPPFEVIRSYARAMARSASAAEKRQALNRARVLRAYVEAVEQELGTPVTQMQKELDAKIPHD